MFHSKILPGIPKGTLRGIRPKISSGTTSRIHQKFLREFLKEFIHQFFPVFHAVFSEKHLENFPVVSLVIPPRIYQEIVPWIFLEIFQFFPCVTLGIQPKGIQRNVFSIL